MQRLIYGNAQDMREAIIQHLVGAKHGDIDQQVLGNAMGISCKEPDCGMIFCIGIPVLERDKSELGNAYREFLALDRTRNQVITDILIESRQRRRKITPLGAVQTSWERILNEDLY